MLVAILATACGSSSQNPAADAATPPDAPLPDAVVPDAPPDARPDAPTIDAPPAGPDFGLPPVSRALALTADGASLWVVNPDSDSVSVIDTSSRTLRREISLSGNIPAVDPTTNRYDPPVTPRALALDEPLGKLYVAGEFSSQIYVIDLATMTVMGTIPIAAEPTAVVASPDGKTVYVVSHQAATVSRIDTTTDEVTATLVIGQSPWGASLRADGSALNVSHFLLDPGVTVIDTASFTVRGFTSLPDQPRDPGGDKLIPSGKVRGAYSVVPRPGTGELWVPHLLLAIGTPQPDLDFESTVFPTISTLAPGGQATTTRILFKPPTEAGAPGNFSDSCSGPRDVAFTPAGKYALVALAQSEDVMIFGTTTDDEVDLVRPVPSTMLEGIVVDPTRATANLLGPKSHPGTQRAKPEAPAGPTVTVDGAPIDALTADPMPANLRLGQRLFYTANSAAYPVTQNFWVACSTCHLEGRSDAVTWLFAQGPRDTPSNAGGPINTGFLFRQAVRNDVIDYDQTIRVEQGGAYDRTNPAQLPQLQALAAYVNYAIPFPPNPNLASNGTLTPSQQNGQALFATSCATCHAGPFFTDSGMGNPTLDPAGPVVLHDIGTCVTTGAHPDVASTDIDGDPRTPCAFDTPTLRGIFATPPYFHDGSAATLLDAVMRIPVSAGLTAAQQADLVNYLETL